MISASPGMAGLLSSIRKDGISRRRNTAGGGGNGRLFVRRQKRNNTRGGSSYSADRAASLQSSRDRRAKAQDRIKSKVEKQRTADKQERKRQRDYMESPEYKQQTAEIKVLKARRDLAKAQERERIRKQKEAIDQMRREEFRMESYGGLLA